MENSKKSNKTLYIVLGVVGGLIILCGLCVVGLPMYYNLRNPNNNQNPTPTPTVTATNEPTATTTTIEKKYQEIFRFTGTGTKNSEVFVTTGEKFKVTYDCKVTSPSSGVCTAYLYSADSDLPEGIIVNSGQSIKDETVFTKPGKYTIKAITFGTNFTFTVEDYK